MKAKVVVYSYTDVKYRVIVNDYNIVVSFEMCHLLLMI